MSPPSSVIRDTKNNLEPLADSIQTSTEVHSIEDNDNHEYKSNELATSSHDSLLTSLNRVCFYWRQLVYYKTRSILTIVFVTILNIAARLTYFTQQTALDRSTSQLTSVATSSSIRTVEEDNNHSSTSLINYNPSIELPSLENSTMAHMLVQQHRTPNMTLHQEVPTDNKSLLPMSHSVDDRLFHYKSDSTSLIQFLQRLTSEPQMSMYHSTSNGYLNRNTPSVNLCLPFNQVKQEHEQATISCDTIEPIVIEDMKSNTTDTISSVEASNEFDEDVILNANSSLSTDRHFRRRKRRSSLTPTSSLSIDDTEPLQIDVLEKVDSNNNNLEEKSQECTEHSPPLSTESPSLNETNEEKKAEVSVEKDESSDTTSPASRVRRRELRYRFYRHPPSTSQESPPDNTIQFFIPTEAPASPPPTPSTPPPSPPATTSSSVTNSTALPGGLKRIGSTGATKKMVRFADSVGRELAQVQYIQSLIDDDDDEFRDFVFTKSNLYVQKSFYSESKPWSFDVTSNSKQLSDNRLPKRFFCLYRQPNSEHPDVYLHDVWKSQIKLEHADIRVKSSVTGEQYLFGTAWVTNAGYWKNVTVKYTFNRWLNTYEYEAQHRRHSNDFRNIDHFEFRIDIPQDVDRMEFVLRYNVNGQEYWDNNEGKNYILETESSSTPQTTISLPHDCDFNEMRFY